MNGIINKHKWGDCTCGCGQRGVPCVKVGKYLIALNCNRNNKVKKMVEKAKEKNIARGLGSLDEVVDADSIRELTLDLDRVVSRYIRLRDMEADGKITCYICEKRILWSKAHCMHFISRGHLGTRFLLDNLRSGCYECNVTKSGNLVEFEKKLNLENVGIVELLKEQSYTVSHPTRYELKELLISYQHKLNLVESKLK